MRQTISGVVAAIAVMTAGAAPALACGFSACAPYAQGYGYAPTVVGTGCGSCGYDVYQRMAEPDTQYNPATRYSPTTQYYYVNQGPTYSGPGMFAPYPTYQEKALGADERALYWHHHYHHGYARHHDGYPLRRYY
jgi:hypothetical protein